MQAKRPRLESFGESDSGNGGALKKTATMPAELESEQTYGPVGILTVSSPEVAEESVHSHLDVNGELASFLEKCHFCRKRMFNADAFMYGYLRAFCTPECRSKHIAIEKLVKMILRQQKERASANQNSSSSNSNSSSNNNNNNNNNVKNGSVFEQPKPSCSE